jgi:hypothetical protein
MCKYKFSLNKTCNRNNMEHWLLVFSSPPRPDQKNHPQPTQKRFPIKTSSSPMCWPRVRFPDQSLSTNELCGPHRGFVTGTKKRPSVNTVKNTYFKPSCHLTRTKTVSRPTQGMWWCRQKILFPPRTKPFKNDSNKHYPQQNTTRRVSE